MMLLNPAVPFPFLGAGSAMFGDLGPVSGPLGDIVGGIAGGISDGINIFEGVKGGFEAGMTAANQPPPKQRGNYCFGVDGQICEWIRTSPIGGWAYPACIVVTNTLCVVLGILAMVTVLGVAVYVLLEH
jgi:hypothetical protein